MTFLLNIFLYLSFSVSVNSLYFFLQYNIGLLLPFGNLIPFLSFKYI